MNIYEKKLESLEIKLLLEGIFVHYGYDFRDYAPASLTRRINSYKTKMHFKCVSDIIPYVLHNKENFINFVYELSVPVSEMFRDYEFFKVIRNNIVSYLRTWPYIKIWHAGCASGEEVYSMAILLQEEKLYKKATIYATDINDPVLEKAKEGIFPLEKAKDYTINYQKSGGIKSFSEYYYAKYDSMIMDKSLKGNLVFSNHNLATDGIFSEMHLIMCRNVLIYFDKALQDRVLNLFTESLVPGGILALGSKESMTFSSVLDKYDVIDNKWRIYKKKVI